MLYSEKVMDHFTHPRNLGKMDDADGVGEVGNAKCGDIMKIYIKVENDVITDVKFNTFGCGSAIASSSMATEMIKGSWMENLVTGTIMAEGGIWITRVVTNNNSLSTPPVASASQSNQRNSRSSGQSNSSGSRVGRKGRVDAPW